eukprot:6571839-Prymnesium_polylepis.1
MASMRHHATAAAVGTSTARHRNVDSASSQRPSLTCSPQRIGAIFPPGDPSWRAADVIHAVERARAAL